MHQRYPRDISVSAVYTQESARIVDETITDLTKERNYDITDKDDARYYECVVVRKGDKLSYEAYFSSNADGQQCTLGVVPLEDYNKLIGDNAELNKGTALLYTNRKAYKENKINIGDTTYNVKSSEGSQNDSDKAKRLDSIFGTASIDSYYLVVDSMETVYEIMEASKDAIKDLIPPEELDDFNMLRVVQFNMDATAQEQIDFSLDVDKILSEKHLEEKSSYADFTESKAANINDFYNTYGGFFSLGYISEYCS